MKQKYDKAIAGTFVPAIACGCLLGSTIAASAQTEEPEVDELAPITLEQREEPGADELAPIILEQREEPEVDELALIILEQRDVAVEPALMDESADSIDGEPEEFAAEAESDGDTLRRLFIAFREAVLSSSHDEADTLAKQIVELSIRVNGLDSRETATALSNLAVAQHGMENFQSAILNYTAAIGIIERTEDRLSAALVNPLRGLGAAQFGAGRSDLATKSFERAIHIGQVNDGPHNLDQIEALMALTEIYLSVGETKEAVKIQKRIYYLQARNVSTNSLGIIPALETRADWQRRMKMYDQERFTWRRIINVIEKAKGKDSLALIEPLTSLANSYLAVVYVGVPANAQPAFSSGDPYLKRAVRIAERNPDSTLQIRVDAKLELGDYYILTDNANRAHGVYRDVWNMLSADESLLGLRRDLLESGQLLRDVYPPKRLDDRAAATSGEQPQGYRTGTALFAYDVNTRGRVNKIRLLEADPEGLDELYKQIGRELRFIVYRPRMMDGEAQETIGLTFNHEFFYRDSDLGESNEESDEQSELAAETAASNQETPVSP